MSIRFYNILTLFAAILWNEGYATHNRAGEILYEYLSPLTYRVNVITYSKISGASASADRDSIFINWGDGTIEGLKRTNGIDTDEDNIPEGVEVANDIKKNIYIGTHTYGGALPFYIISVTDPNRIEDIVNIAGGAGSVKVKIYYEDTLKYVPPELFESNSSPQLLNPPIDYANLLDTFYHNPNAYDPDGDSLSFALMPSLQGPNLQVPAYQFPDEIIPGPNNSFTINEQTGEIIWAVPQQVGIYNIAILVREFRNGECIGTMIRDMEIFVLDEPNDPPQIQPIQDTCVVAGDVLNVLIRATDPDGDNVTLSVAGGPLENSPQQIDVSASSGNPALLELEWQTRCEDIRPAFYQFVFKATDNYISSSGQNLPLVDLETWLVRVIPPAPQNLQEVVTSNNVSLSWEDPYECIGFENFQYFSVWRRYGCENIDRTACEIGLGGTDYEQIGITTDYNYLDENIDRGHIYSYRIVAHFATNPQSPAGNPYNWVESIPSNEVCVELPLSLPVITNVSIEATSTSDGIAFVQWSKPKAGNDALDTIQDPPPYVYELFRSDGFHGQNMQSIASFTSPTYADANDTMFFDTLLNTVDSPYSYQVSFLSDGGNENLGETSIASSIYLTIQPSDQILRLRWREEVPWVNETYDIFRFNNNTNQFDSLTTVTDTFYVDEGLINDSTYCYFVRSRGRYSSSGLIDPIINLSQEACGVPIDTIPPCPPVYEVHNDCETIPNQAWTQQNFQNRLSWEIDSSCADDVVGYNIYFSESGVEPLMQVGQTDQSTFVHQLSNSLAGCYVVTAFDEKDNESVFSDTICIDNCPYYILPNAFSPNGDGSNDVFMPFPGWRFVDHVELKIYNRWGNIVFQTADPNINWDGTDYVSGKSVHDGVYLYSGFIYVQTIDGIEKRPIPSNSGGGVIHLFNNE